MMLPVLIVVGIVLLLGGGAAVVKFSTRDEVRARIRGAAAIRGFQPPIQEGLVAIATVESDLDPRAIKLSGSDGDRGGAWGLFQLTLTTARSLGFSGAAAELLDEETNISWAMQLAASINASKVEDLAAAWNSGKRYADLADNHPTRASYVPAVLAVLNEAEA